MTGTVNIFGIDAMITQTGVLSEYRTSGEYSVRFVVEQADAANIIQLHGRILGQSNYDLLATLSGNIEQNLVIAPYDFLRVTTTVYASVANKNFVHFLASGIAETSSPGGVTSVNGFMGDVVLTKTDIGLSNVNNTSDANKPVSSAQQAAIDLKVNKSGDTMTGSLTVPNLSINGSSFLNSDGSASIANSNFLIDITGTIIDSNLNTVMRIDPNYGAALYSNIDISGIPSVDFSNSYALNDGTGTPSITWVSRQLYNQYGETTCNYDFRQLIGIGGSPCLSWDDGSGTMDITPLSDLYARVSSGSSIYLTNLFNNNGLTITDTSYTLQTGSGSGTVSADSVLTLSSGTTSIELNAFTEINANSDFVVQDHALVFKTSGVQRGKIYGVFGGGSNAMNFNVGVDQNFGVYPPISLGSGVAFGVANDASTANLPMEFRASQYYFWSSPVTMDGTLKVSTISTVAGSLTLSPAVIASSTLSVNSSILLSVNTAAPNATIPVSQFKATNAATNGDIAITPKGTGAILAQIPDSLATGGNKRGTNAVDFQVTRSANTMVASGSNSTAIGLNNTSSGTTSTSIGNGNTNSATNGIALGLTNTISASGTAAIGTSNTVNANSAVAIGNGNTASGVNSFITGQSGSTFGVLGRRVHSSSILAVLGDSQISDFGLRNSTTNATATRLTADAGAATAANILVFQNNQVMTFKGEIIAKQTGTTNVGVWTIDGIAVRGASAATMALVGTPTIVPVSNLSVWGTPTVTADTTLGGLNISVTGLAATNIRWYCNLKTTELIY